jgi:hypothetical protein
MAGSTRAWNADTRGWSLTGGPGKTTGTRVATGDFAIGTRGAVKPSQAGTVAVTDIAFTDIAFMGTIGFLKLGVPPPFAGNIDIGDLASDGAIDLGPVSRRTAAFDGHGGTLAIGAAGPC